jgi:hypothetical protein
MDRCRSPLKRSLDSVVGYVDVCAMSTILPHVRLFVIGNVNEMTSI